ncbi:MAG: DUF1640 domain-containing protein [Magnetococcales bacterium]|nr:DUF1640 domain-containing protein [Magnetococcales bacterium]
MNAAIATFDTLKFVRRLRDAGVDEKQTEAFSEAIKDAQNNQLQELTTKGDLRELEIRLERRMDTLNFDLRLIKWMLALVITATVLPALKTLIG